jgi:hypothetical protein
VIVVTSLLDLDVLFFITLVLEVRLLAVPFTPFAGVFRVSIVPVGRDVLRLVYQRLQTAYLPMAPYLPVRLRPILISIPLYENKSE